MARTFVTETGAIIMLDRVEVLTRGAFPEGAGWYVFMTSGEKFLIAESDLPELRRSLEGRDE